MGTNPSGDEAYSHVPYDGRVEMGDGFKDKPWAVLTGGEDFNYGLPDQIWKMHHRDKFTLDEE